MKKFAWFLFAFFAIGVGIYPSLYLISQQKMGILNAKAPELLNNILWNTAFYLHIIFGGIALITGWSQFSEKLRNRRLNLHRNLGKIYVSVVLLSGMAGLFLAIHATGGIIAKSGFTCLAILWLSTTGMAYYSIRQRSVEKHRRWMIRSYAVCFAAVTLRIWLPLFQGVFGLEFIFSYQMVAWLCWVPNVVFAEWLISKTSLKRAVT